MLTYSTYTQTLGEASSGIKVEDLWKRDNLEIFISKATSGELVDKSNNKIPALSKNNDSMCFLRRLENTQHIFLVTICKNCPATWKVETCGRFSFRRGYNINTRRKCVPCVRGEC